MRAPVHAGGFIIRPASTSTFPNVLAIWIELALNVAIQCPHDADPREHCRAARRRDQDQRFHRGLPLGGFVLGLRKLRDVVAGILERDELATAGQGDWIFEMAAPSSVRLQ